MHGLDSGKKIRKNVLVGSDGAVKLVDFDWAGEHASFDSL